MDSRQLNCLIEGESIVFVLTVGNYLVSDLKESIQLERALGGLKDIDPHALELWKLKDCNSIAAEPDDTLVERIGLLGHDLLEFADKLGPTRTVFSVFPTQPPIDYIHIIVKVPRTDGKRKRDDPIDVSRKLFNLWTAPVQHDIKLLQAYLDEPLSPDWKIPLSHFEWKRLLFNETVRAHACSDQDLELLFTQCDDECANAIGIPLQMAITGGPPDSDGTEDSFHSFWDANFRNILAPCLDAKTIRNSNQGTATGLLRPDFGLLLTNACIFRGEEKRVGFSGDPPEIELRVKTRWVYDPAPYILGYHAVGPVVVLSAILQQGGSIRIVDLIEADLSSRRERIKNASRMIKMCGILRYLRSVIREGKDRDMFLQFRAGGKSLKFYTSFVRKIYGIEDGDDGEERIKHLRAIYAALASKGVPNVDRLKDSKIRDCARGSYADLEPRGKDQSPESPTDIRNAVVCILETLKACHADPQIFHRDIRWPNVIQNREDPTNWFLIDWEDASFAPTKAAQHFNRVEHSPKVFEDNHGAEVDMWAVGRLMVTARTQIPAYEALGRKMMAGDVLNAEQGLEEINGIQALAKGMADAIR